MALDSSSFNGARLKVQRANRHIDKLKAAIASFCATPFYELIVNENPGGSRVIVRPTKPIPNDFPFIIGDAVHNLRSALDYLATACCSAGGGRGKDLFFPFHKKRKDLVSDRAKLDPIEIALPGSKRLILDEIEPCEDGRGKDLYALHTLDKTDKHHQIIVTYAIATSGNLFIFVDGKPELSARAMRFDADKETPIPIVFSGGKTTVQHDYKATLEIFFGEPDLLRGKEVIEKLIMLSERVSEIIKLFSALI